MAKQIISAVKWVGTFMIALATLGFINILLIATGASY